MDRTGGLQLRAPGQNWSSAPPDLVQKSWRSRWGVVNPVWRSLLLARFWIFILFGRKLLGTSATLVVTGALLVVTKKLLGTSASLGRL